MMDTQLSPTRKTLQILCAWSGCRAQSRTGLDASTLLLHLLLSATSASTFESARSDCFQRKADHSRRNSTKPRTTPVRELDRCLVEEDWRRYGEGRADDHRLGSSSFAQTRSEEHHPSTPCASAVSRTRSKSDTLDSM
jgi:hypothetical protein